MNYLAEQFEKLRELYPDVKQVGMLRDAHGVYALTIQRYGKRPCYFCAKNSINKTVVSIHKKLFDIAYREKAWIVMSVQGRFMNFYAPHIAMGKNWVNEYHGAQMINFSIYQGSKVTLPEKESSLFEKKEEIMFATANAPAAQILNKE